MNGRKTKKSLSPQRKVSKVSSNKKSSRSSEASIVGETLEGRAEYLKVHYASCLRYNKINAVIGDTILRQLGYEIREVFANGKYSNYKRLLRSEAEFAVKIVEKSQVPERFLKVFYLNELSIVKELNHKNILKYIQGIETCYRVYLIAKLAINGTLKELLNRMNFLPEDLGQQFFMDMLQAISYCHSKKIAVCNIKSSNFLLDNCYNLKLYNFKFANKFERDVEKCFTYCGDHHYTAPEVLLCKPFDPFIADVWSLGVVYFEMLTGKLPFHGLKEEFVENAEKFSVFYNAPKVSIASMETLVKIFQPIDNRLTLDKLLSEAWVKEKLSCSNSDCLGSRRRSTGLEL